jgi:hypothetical protein
MPKDPRVPARMWPSSTPGRHPGGRTCAVTLFGLLSAPRLIDLLLTGSQTIA